MALPAPNTPWPPQPYDVALRQQAIWSTWLEGDVEKLASVYGSASPVSLRGDLSSREGGVLPAIARFFWGRPSVTGQRRQKLHVPLAADIATASADLLFSEPPQFVAGNGKGASQERVDECFNQGKFHARLLEAAELAAGLGGCFLRLAWDKELFDWVMVEPVDADAGLAEWHWGKLAAVTFFTEVARDDQKSEVLRHLERHEPGWILHGLYRGTASSLGRQILLEEHPTTAGLVSTVTEEGAIATGVKGLTVGYAANMRPQKAWRKIEMLSDLGRSDFDGPVMDLMDALDETLTSWMRELRLAKARLIVPEHFLKPLGKGKGAMFDEDQEVFTLLNMLGEKQKGEPNITPQQFEMRTEQYKATFDQLVDQILDTAGYSPSTFGRGGEGDNTATEVVSRERKSARTRDKKARYFTEAFEILGTWAELDRLIYGQGSSEPITVVWPDAVQPDPEALARTMQTLRTAEAASTLVLVRMQHPDWEEDKITEEVERIQDESGRRLGETVPFGGA